MQPRVKPNLFVVEGGISSGKSTILKEFVENDSYNVILERVDEFQDELEAFYNEQNGVNFLKLQNKIYDLWRDTLCRLFCNVNNRRWLGEGDERIVIMERSPFSSIVFMKANMQLLTKEEYDQMKNKFLSLEEHLQDFFIVYKFYLDVHSDRMVVRNQKRGNDDNIDVDYLLKVAAIYDDMVNLCGCGGELGFARPRRGYNMVFFIDNNHEDVDSSVKVIEDYIEFFNKDDHEAEKSELEDDRPLRGRTKSNR